ncbi:hypothetical protein PLESTB_000408000 [Pleodorina starrii]|uniref:Protein NO VEIN C-terminal domain-containing protein n=1 Tax=Pleodorina starrii TaxID=330485 RepID=A0A9W6EZJ9_9CHLO|nr:hypothetical protein PLESTB_000408000 [Pleodorina starrii]GLC75296.1 hypothetical protein PLESTF_001619300 [Pleodorina starrii]
MAQRVNLGGRAVVVTHVPEGALSESSDDEEQDHAGTSLPAHTTPANLRDVVQAVRTLKAVLEAKWPVNGWTPEALSSLKSEFSGNRSRLWELIEQIMLLMQREPPALPSPSTTAVAAAADEEEEATSGSTAAIPAAPAEAARGDGRCTSASANAVVATEAGKHERLLQHERQDGAELEPHQHRHKHKQVSNGGASAAVSTVSAASAAAVPAATEATTVDPTTTTSTSEASSGAATLESAAASAGTQGLPLVKRAGPPNSQANMMLPKGERDAAGAAAAADMADTLLRERLEALLRPEHPWSASLLALTADDASGLPVGGARAKSSNVVDHLAVLLTTDPSPVCGGAGHASAAPDTPPAGGIAAPRPREEYLQLLSRLLRQRCAVLTADGQVRILVDGILVANGRSSGQLRPEAATTRRRLGAGGGQQQLQTTTNALLAQLRACRSRVAGAAARDLALAAMPRAPGDHDDVVYMSPALQVAAATAAADAAADADTEGEVPPVLGDLLPLLSAGGEAADEWLLLSNIYAARFPGLRATELLRLFEQLGVKTFPEPTPRRVELTAAELQAIPWAADDAAAGMSAQAAPPQPSCKPKQPSEAAVDAPVAVLDWSCLALLRLVLQAMGTPTAAADVAIPSLRLLAQLLAAHWDRFEAAMDAHLLLEPLAPPLSLRRPQGPSSIAFELRALPWLVARLGGELCLRRPVEVFAPLRPIKQVLGPRVPYVDIWEEDDCVGGADSKGDDSSCCSSPAAVMLRQLGVVYELTLQVMLDLLRTWSSRDGAYASSLSFMAGVYGHLGRQLARLDDEAATSAGSNASSAAAAVAAAAAAPPAGVRAAAAAGTAAAGALEEGGSHPAAEPGSSHALQLKTVIMEHLGKERIIWLPDDPTAVLGEKDVPGRFHRCDEVVISDPANVLDPLLRLLRRLLLPGKTLPALLPPRLLPHHFQPVGSMHTTGHTAAAGAFFAGLAPASAPTPPGGPFAAAPAVQDPPAAAHGAKPSAPIASTPSTRGYLDALRACAAAAQQQHGSADESRECAAITLRILTYWARQLAAGELKGDDLAELRKGFLGERLLPCVSGKWRQVDAGVCWNDDPWVADALRRSSSSGSAAGLELELVLLPQRPLPQQSAWGVRHGAAQAAGHGGTVEGSVSTLLEALGVRPLSLCVSISVRAYGPPTHGTALESAVRKAILAAEPLLWDMTRMTPESERRQRMGAVKGLLQDFRVLVVPSFTAELSLVRDAAAAAVSGSGPLAAVPAAWQQRQQAPQPTVAAAAGRGTTAAAPVVTLERQPRAVMAGSRLFVLQNAAYGNLSAISLELTRLLNCGRPWPALAARLRDLLRSAVAGRVPEGGRHQPQLTVATWRLPPPTGADDTETDRAPKRVRTGISGGGGGAQTPAAAHAAAAGGGITGPKKRAVGQENCGRGAGAAADGRSSSASTAGGAAAAIAPAAAVRAPLAERQVQHHQQPQQPQQPQQQQPLQKPAVQTTGTNCGEVQQRRHLVARRSGWAVSENEDPREQRNRETGRKGEAFVYQLLKRELMPVEGRTDDDAAAALEDRCGARGPLQQVGPGGRSRVADRVAGTVPATRARGRPSVEWVNESAETGSPYDLIIHYPNGCTEFVEVKSTAFRSKDRFDISLRELNFAYEQGARYVVYQVLDTNGDRPVVVRWPDLKGMVQSRAARVLFTLPRQ